MNKILLEIYEKFKVIKLNEIKKNSDDSDDTYFTFKTLNEKAKECSFSEFSDWLMTSDSVFLGSHKLSNSNLEKLSGGASPKLIAAGKALLGSLEGILSGSSKVTWTVIANDLKIFFSAYADEIAGEMMK